MIPLQVLHKKTKDGNQFIKSVYNKYFIASFFAILCSGLGQIANSVVVGNVLGTKALSVMSLVVPVYYVFATLGNLLGIGGSAVCASLMGKSKHEECKKAFTVTYLLTLVFSLLFTMLLIPVLPKLIRLLGADNALYQDVYRYVIIMVIGGVFTAGIYLSFNFLRLDGRNKESTAVFVLMAAVNIVLDVALTVFVKLGLLGVSLATAAGAAAATFFGAILLFTKSKSLCLTKVNGKEILNYTKDIFTIGSPGAAENICILLRSFLLNRLILAQFGTVALSAFSVVNSVNSFSLSIIAGAAGTLVPFVGIFSAEKDTKSIKQTLKISLSQGVIFTGIFVAVCMTFASEIGTMFGMSSVQEQQIVVPALRLFCLSLIPSLINNILIYLHLANEKTAVSNVMTVLRNFALIVGFAFLLSSKFGINGLWISFFACEIGTLALTAVMHQYLARKNCALSKYTLLDDTYEKNGTSISFTANGTSDSVLSCVEQISSFCEQNDLTPKRSMLISLSLEEMLFSICKYSLEDNPTATMSVRIFLYENIIVLRIRNGGKLFNPIDYYEKHKKGSTNDLDAMLELEDSLGIKMIVDACDVVDYRTTFGVNNLTVII